MKLEVFPLLVFAVLPIAVLGQHCPYGWITKGSDPAWPCFLITNKIQRSWQVARAFCTEMGGDMAKFDSVDERDWLFNILQAYTGYNNHTEWWIGLHDNPAQTGLVWSDLSNVDPKILNFIPGEQTSYDHRKACVEYFNGQMRHQDCSLHQYYTCKRPRSTRLFCDAFHGWETRNGMCLKVITKLQSWDDSRAACQAEGGDLFQDNSVSLHQVMLDYTEARQASFWIGLRGYVDSTHTSVNFLWNPPSGTQLVPLNANWDHANFNPSQVVLNSHGYQACVWASVNNTWQLNNCSAGSFAVCQKPEDTCASGWFSSDGYCFAMITHSKMTWTDAKGYCQSYNADLLRIRTQSQQLLINFNLRQYYSMHMDSIWLGLSDSGAGETLAWSNGDAYSPNSFNNLDKSYTNTPGRQDCINIYTDNANGTWQASGNCSALKAVLCSMRAGITPTIPTTAPPTLPSGQTAITTTPAPVNWTSECGPFWVKDPVTHYCYFFSDNVVTWFQAESSCESQGGQLASIKNYQEQRFVQDRLFGYKSPALFVGMNELNVHQGYHWNDGTPVAYLNWNPGEPNNVNNNEQCGEIATGGTSLGKWNDVPCNAQRGYICKKKANDFPNPSPTRPPIAPIGMKLGCPDNTWVPYGNSFCFLVIQHRFNWQDAHQFCTSHGGDLASIDDEDQQNFVFSQLPVITGFRDQYWIGLNDQNSQMVFEWTDGTDVKFTKWQENEPNNWADRPEDCVAMYQRHGTWNDETCDNPQGGLVCKVPIKGVDQATPQMVLNQGCPPLSGSDAIKQYAYGYKCYFRGTSKMAWTNAQQFCSSKGGQLAVIRDEYQQSYLSYYISDVSDDFWVGVSTGSNGSIQVVGGTNLTFTFWTKNHTGQEANTCVSIRNRLPSRGGWVNSNCGTNQYPLCESSRSSFSTPLITTPTTLTPPTCPSGWVEHSGYCYKGYSGSDKATWFEAREFCRRMRTHLVSIHDSSENTFIFSSTVFGPSQFWFQGSYVSSMWIGLSDFDTEKAYAWEDGSPLNYAAWSQGEPNDADGSDDCVESYSSHRWNDNNCYLAKPFVCKVLKGQSIREQALTTTPASLVDCGGSPNWKLYNGTCYYVSPPTGTQSRLSWYDATDYCVKNGGNLASIHGEQENGFLITLVSKMGHSAGGVWLGLSDVAAAANEFSWTDGTVLDYTKWQGGEPNNAFGSEKCGQMWSSNGFWNDNDCNEMFHYVCKRPQGAATPGHMTNPPLIQGGCPQGFSAVLYDNKCYQILGSRDRTARLNYTNAVASCRKMCRSCDLASINNHQEMAALTATLNGAMIDQTGVWIGLNDNNNNRAFTWQDNSRLVITNWDRNEPQQSGGQCVEMYTDLRHAGRWHNIRCSDTRAYACEATKDPGVAIATPPPECTAPGYVSNNNLDCYKVITIAMPWNNAKAACENDKAHLASINSLFDQAFVDTLLGNINTPVWIGLADPQQTGTYVWADNSRVLYTSWDRGEPSYTTDHRCVATNNGLWNDTLCTLSYPAICKQSFFPPPTPSEFPSGYCKDITWTQFDQYCYLFVFDQLKTWTDADADCTARGMTMVSIHDRNEEDFVFRIQASDAGVSSNIDLWIGFRRSGQYFSWSDSSSIGYVNWKSGPVQDCTYLQYTTGQWVTDFCTQRKHYACKTLKLPATSPTTTLSTSTTTTTSTSTTSTTSTTTTTTVKPPPTTTQTSTTRTTLGPITHRLQIVTTPSPSSIQQQQQQQSGLPGDLGSGQIAGILVGVICIIILVSGILILLKRRPSGTLFTFGRLNNDGSGFDNAVYDRTDDVVAIKTTSGSNGIANGQGFSGFSDPSGDYDDVA